MGNYFGISNWIEPWILNMQSVYIGELLSTDYWACAYIPLSVGSEGKFIVILEVESMVLYNTYLDLVCVDYFKWFPHHIYQSLDVVGSNFLKYS
jgi:hypothetical protein